MINSFGSSLGICKRILNLTAKGTKVPQSSESLPIQSGTSIT